MAGGGRRRGRGWRGPELVGALLIAIGAIYLLDTLDFFAFSWRIGWPIVLIVVGILFLARATQSGGARESSASVPREGTEQLELHLSLGAGIFRLAGEAGERPADRYGSVAALVGVPWRLSRGGALRSGPRRARC